MLVISANVYYLFSSAEIVQSNDFNFAQDIPFEYGKEYLNPNVSALN